MCVLSAFLTRSSSPCLPSPPESPKLGADRPRAAAQPHTWSPVGGRLALGSPSRPLPESLHLQTHSSAHLGCVVPPGRGRVPTEAADTQSFYPTLRTSFPRWRARPGPAWFRRLGREKADLAPQLSRTTHSDPASLGRRHRSPRPLPGAEKLRPAHREPSAHPAMGTGQLGRRQARSTGDRCARGHF